MSSNPPSSIVVNELFNGSVGVSSTLQFGTNSMSTAALAKQIELAIVNAPADSSSILGGFVTGSLSVSSWLTLFTLVF